MDIEHKVTVHLKKKAKGSGGDCYEGGILSALYLPQEITRKFPQNEPAQTFTIIITNGGDDG